jgi:hypothetical protein
MQLVTHARRSTPAAGRSVKCVFCRDAIAFTDPTRTTAVCRLCASEIEEFGWRTVYDRDQNIGQIPANLRSAYKL